MKLYTKRGDDGTTSLVGGKRVSKAHLRVMAYGDMDELISWLGLLRSEVSEDFQLRRIQIFLMQASAHLASDHQVAKLKPLNEAEISFLESEIDRMTDAIPAQKHLSSPPLLHSRQNVISPVRYVAGLKEWLYGLKIKANKIWSQSDMSIAFQTTFYSGPLLVLPLRTRG